MSGDFHYLIGHSDEALSPAERVLRRLDEDDVRHEFDEMDLPFRLFFHELQEVEASHVRHGPDSAIIKVKASNQEHADALVGDYLKWWSQEFPGLAVVLIRRLTSS